jgi:hypothetical protein
LVWNGAFDKTIKLMTTKTNGWKKWTISFSLPDNTQERIRNKKESNLPSGRKRSRDNSRKKTFSLSAF